MSRSRKRRKIVIFTLIGFVLLALIIWSVVGKQEVMISVETETVGREDLTEIVVSNGRIEPVTEVKISPEVSGEIVELPVVEGQKVSKGDLLLRIKPEQYVASRKSAQAGYDSALAGLFTSKAELARAEAEMHRNEELFEQNLISESIFMDFKTSYDVAGARAEQAEHQIASAKAALERADEDLLKTTLYAPLDGTVTRLTSRQGERVHGTAMMAGTEIMTIADLDEMDARVDIGEMDIVQIKTGQMVMLEVDAFRDEEFTGYVSEIANSAKGLGAGNASSQEATKFEVRIRINEKKAFRPGMSVTAEIETQYRTNAIAVPFASVTTRPPLNSTNSVEQTNAPVAEDAELPDEDQKKKKKRKKDVDVVFVVEGDHVKQMPVTIGISDEDSWEIVEGLEEGVTIVTGGYRAIRDLEDGAKIIEDGGPGSNLDADDDNSGD